MHNDFISICILGYKRQEMLDKCLESLHKTLDFPAEIIVNFDGEGELSFPEPHRYSKLIINGGQNRGVGRSLQNCLGVAEGRIILKCDSDIVFKPLWASSVVSLLDSYLEIGALSLFNYQNYDPNDERFKILEDRSDYYTVNDFVSSCYAFRLADAYRYDDGPLYNKGCIPDDGLHQQFGKMAIPKLDLVDNVGFGRKSVYVSFDGQGNPSKTKTHDSPLIFS